MEIALEAGADDVTTDGDIFEIVCQISAFSAVRQALAEKEIETISAEIAMVPKNTVSIDADRARKVLAVMEAFEDNDDVQNVYANFDLPADVVADLEE